jgi:hypothetical protein
MRWPTPQDYNEAVQHPPHCFSDQALRSGVPELTPLGLPRPITGNFASVYRLHCGGRDWAVRCFFRQFADMGDRYAAIGEQLAATRLGYTVGFEYLPRGIRVQSEWYPILKMEWIEGELLHEVVSRSLTEPSRLRHLASRWVRMVHALERASVAHGDLQHGNVLVVGSDFKLVDYDGMFVPLLAGKGSHEVGHPNYQHPRRTGHDFSPTIDRFSAWVIYASLEILSVDPDLWQVASGDECLLFRKPDFDSPATSPLFSRIRVHSSSRVQALGQRLEQLLTLPPTALPPLEDLQARARAPSSTLPAWVVDFVPAPTPRRVTPRVPRFVAVCTAAIVPVLAVLGVSFWAACAVYASLLAGILLAAFHLDPGVRQCDLLRWRLLRARMRRHWIEWQVDRCRVRRDRLDRWYDSRVVEISRRRKDARSRADRERGEVEAALRPLVKDCETALAALDRVARESLEQAAHTYRERRLRRQLRRVGIYRAPVNWPTRIRLFRGGVRSAAAINVASAPVLRTINPGVAADLLSWRMSLEALCSQGPESTLPPRRVRPLVDAVLRERRRLARRQDRLLRRISFLNAATDAHATRRCVPLDRRIKKVASRHQLRAARLEQVSTAQSVAHSRVLGAIADLEVELNTLNPITLRRYLTAVVKPG